MLVPLVLYGAGAYVADVMVRPERAALRARIAANRRAKPMLNVGAGLGYRGPRNALQGPHMVGDLNVDITGNGRPQLGDPGHVYFADVHDLPFPDKFFGSALACHVLEHVDDPVRAQSELARVADETFIVCPRWWGFHTWLQPDHQWYRTADGRWLPLHRKRPAV